jgi:hypothetical protein
MAIASVGIGKIRVLGSCGGDQIQLHGMIGGGAGLLGYATFLAVDVLPFLAGFSMR